MKKTHWCKEEDPNSHDGKKTPFEHLISAFLTEAEIIISASTGVNEEKLIVSIDISKWSPGGWRFMWILGNCTPLNLNPPINILPTAAMRVETIQLYNTNLCLLKSISSLLRNEQPGLFSHDVKRNLYKFAWMNEWNNEWMNEWMK